MSRIKLSRDIWRIGVVDAPIAAIWRAGGIEPFATTLLPPEPFMRFLADPFGLWRDGRLHVFAEAYDYRDRRGAIDCLVLDDRFRPIERRRVLDEPWHLSYPHIVEADGETWMLPEAHRSGALTLYRARDFPWVWEAACRIDVPPGAVDATPVFHEGRWWLFHAIGDALHAAHAERLTGPWTPHARAPLRRGLGSRPGGTATLVDGGLVLPVQDCARTYGGAIRPLAIERLTPDAFDATLGEAIAPPRGLAPWTDGLHTLAAAGPVTLIDVKRIELSPRSLGVLAWRALRGRGAARR